MAEHLLAACTLQGHLAASTSKLVASGYPVGPHALAAALAQLTGISLERSIMQHHGGDPPLQSNRSPSCNSCRVRGNVKLSGLGDTLRRDANRLRTGPTAPAIELVITKLDRLGRSLEHLIDPPRCCRAAALTSLCSIRESTRPPRSAGCSFRSSAPSPSSSTHCSQSAPGTASPPRGPVGATGGQKPKLGPRQVKLARQMYAAGARHGRRGHLIDRRTRRLTDSTTSAQDKQREWWKCRLASHGCQPSEPWSASTARRAYSRSARRRRRAHPRSVCAWWWSRTRVLPSLWGGAPHPRGPRGFHAALSTAGSPGSARPSVGSRPPHTVPHEPTVARLP